MYKKLAKAFLILLSIALLPTTSVSKTNHNVINDIRSWSTKDYTRVVVDLNNGVNYRADELKSQKKIYIDLINTSLGDFNKRVIEVKNSGIRKIRIGQFNKSTARIVFDIVKINRYKTFKLSNPDRLVIDIFYNGSKTRKNHYSVGSKRNSFSYQKKRIVIDPGHGGHDPGAIGRTGLKEKNIVLDISLRVEKILRKTYHYDVLLTRKRDIFIPLKRRTVFANSKNADIFVSIHANASKNHNARGIETYLLNWTNDKEALRVAARENRISINKMRRSKNNLGFILASLEREGKRDESLKLAHNIQDSLVSTLQRKYRVRNLGVKGAFFYVLVGANMPSTLVEVSFISNHYEERLLRRHSYRSYLALSIAKGINNYVNSLPDAPKLVKVQTQEFTN